MAIFPATGPGCAECGGVSAWEWPQWVFAGLLFLQLVMHVIHHGKEREKYNGHTAIIDVGLSVWLLWMGGFWK